MLSKQNTLRKTGALGKNRDCYLYECQACLSRHPDMVSFWIHHEQKTSDVPAAIIEQDFRSKGTDFYPDCHFPKEITVGFETKNLIQCKHLDMG